MTGLTNLKCWEFLPEKLMTYETTRTGVGVPLPLHLGYFTLTLICSG